MGLVKPKKFLGQHFLKDLSIAKDIADTVDECPGLPILEVGPGMGVLTQFLMEKGREVKVVELDFESVAYLRENFPALEGNIIEDDFLKLKLEKLFDGRPFVLTGNYPYNISSQIFFKMLDYKDLIPCCTGMIQKEVAERIATNDTAEGGGLDQLIINRERRVKGNRRKIDNPAYTYDKKNRIHFYKLTYRWETVKVFAEELRKEVCNG